ncbi:MAG: response regulator transcription factor [Lachnospiraceae bacterium]
MALIYIVEDDLNIREIETFSLKNSGYEIRDFESAGEFYEAMAERLPDLVLLDVMLPDEDGLSIVKSIRENPESRRLPIIMVTAKTTELDKVKGLDQGADDYLTKPFGVMELVSRVKALLRRCGKDKEKKAWFINGISLDNERHTVFADDKRIELTFKEFKLLQLLLENAGTVTTREMILERVWGTDFEGESRTLDMHIKTLRQKLGERGSMIKTVRNVGYLIEE